MKPVLSLMPLLGVAMLAACGGGVTKPVYDGGCIGWQDDIHTLKPGDELPRVMQVLGPPQRMFRAGSRDVLEYTVGESACTRVLLGAKGDRIRLSFDAQGRYVGQTNTGYGWLSGSPKPLLVDPAVMKP
jgi:hypothetical protein